MSGASARRLAAPAVAAAALALLAPGCDLILSIGDEGRPIEEAFQYTCECVELTSQQGRFAQRCVEERDALLEQVDSDPASRDLALSLAATGCECAEIESCYATLTRASAVGETCGDSSDCSSWACCAPPLEFAVINEPGLGGRSIRLLPENGGTAQCCEPAPAPPACSSCADFLASPSVSPSPPLCAESFDRLSALVDCYAPELRLGTCFTEGCRETDLDLPGCLACLLDLPGCEQQFGACEGDLARPVSP